MADVHRIDENRFIGVDMKNPDFGLMAKAFGVRNWRVDSDAGFSRAIREAMDCGELPLGNRPIERQSRPCQETGEGQGGKHTSPS